MLTKKFLGSFFNCIAIVSFHSSIYGMKTSNEKSVIANFMYGKAIVNGTIINETDDQNNKAIVASNTLNTYSVHNLDKHMELLLTNSAQVLRNGQKMAPYFNKFLNQIFHNDNYFYSYDYRDAFYETVQRLNHIVPTFLLNECPYQPKKKCLLSRHENHWRSGFEEYISLEILKTMHKNQNQFASYVDFGSGSAFSAFKVAAQVLKGNPEGSLHIHLIDQIYTSYISPKNLYFNSYEINENDFSSSQDFQNFTVQSILKGRNPTKETQENKCLAELFCAENQFSFLKSYLHVEAIFKQFLYNLRNNFPKAKIRLFVYKSKDSYLGNISQQNLPHADVITATDILGKEDREKNRSHGHYSSLCLSTLAQNPHLVNCILDLKNSNFELTSISLSKINEQSIAIKNKSDKIYGYLNTPNIDLLAYSTLKSKISSITQMSIFLLMLSHTKQ